MTSRSKSKSTGRLGAALYSTGLLLLALLAFATAWPDMEASVFDTVTASMATEKISGLHCPIAISADETATIRAVFTNHADRDASFLVRTRIAQGFVTLVREDTHQVQLAPGETTTLSWPVTAGDAAYGRVVLARVLAMRGSGNPARESSCGILVVGVSVVTGHQALALALLLTSAILAVGATTWLRGRRPLSERDRSRANVAAFLTIIVAASLASGVWGWWLASHLLLVAALLLLVALLYHRSGS